MARLAERNGPDEAVGAMPSGEVYALDRWLPLGRLWVGLARFQGNSRAVTCWLTRSVAPRLGALAAAWWRAPAAAVVGAGDPFLLCLARGDVREGLRLLVAEWMEFRRLAPASRWRLVVRTCPISAE